MERRMTQQSIDAYLTYLRSEERSVATLQKYGRCLRQLMAALAGGQVEKAAVAAQKAKLLQSRAPGTVNGAIAAWNGFFRYFGWYDCCVRPVRVQRELFLQQEKELTKTEYFRLLAAARERKTLQLFYILQTICATGIRISELPFITVEAVQAGQARIHCKGKVRTILLPKQLRNMLKKYCRGQNIAHGSIFVSKQGVPLDRSNIWRAMKSLCTKAGVAWKKVFPHNLRHLFARCFYALEKDLDALAAVLGHSNINTTRIYTMSTGAQHLKTLEHIRLLL